MAELSFGEGLAVLESRSRRAAVAIWVVIATGLLVALGQLLEAAGTVNLDAETIDGPTLFLGLAYMAFAVAFLVSVVLVSMWIHRAHANLFAAGLLDLDYTPGWSVGWFFIPFANLVKPFQAMRELWNRSYGLNNAPATGTPAIISWWWGCFITGNILSNISSRLENSDLGAGGRTVGAVAGAIGTALIVVGGWFLLKIVKEVMEGQRNHLQASEAFA